MDKSPDTTTHTNATTEISPAEARKKREVLLERARKEAEERGEQPAQDEREDDSIATFILPGD